MLRCREVCKEWNRSVDNFLKEMTQKYTFDEVPPIKKSYSNLQSLNVLKTLKTGWYRFDHKDAATKFASIVSESHGDTRRSPFILNAVHVEEPGFEYDNFGAQAAYWKNLEAVLTKLVRHIREFSFCISSQSTNDNDEEDDEDDYPDFQYYSSKLAQCLGSLTNVTFLNVKGDIVIQERLTNQHREQFHDMATIIQKCPKLTMLRLNGLKDPSSVIQTRLVTLHAEQLTQLSLRISDVDYSWSVPLEIPSLKELHINVKSLTMVESFISRLGGNRDPPKLVKFGFTLCEPRLAWQDEALDRLFQLYAKFGSTLQAVVLKADVEELVSRVAFAKRRYDCHVKVDCPFLRSVRISFFSSLSLNFLQNFSDTLEELHLKMTCDYTPRETKYPDEIVDLYDHIQEMTWNQSNIWEVLPRLQLVEMNYVHLKQSYSVKGRAFRNELKLSTIKRKFGSSDGSNGTVSIGSNISWSSDDKSIFNSDYSDNE